MSNPIDWGGSPIAVSLVRGVIAAILVGASSYLVASMGGTPDDVAFKIGMSSAIPSLLVLLGYGASDQNRANNNVVISGDVPVAAHDVKVIGGK